MTSRAQQWLLPAVLVLAAGCTSSVRLNVLQPARFDLGASRRLSVFQTTGRPGARESTVEELLHQARGEGFFTAADRSAEGAVVKVMNRAINVSGGRALGPEEIGLKIDVLDWNVEHEDKPELWDSAHSKILEYARRVYLGKVMIGVTAFDRDGKVYLSEAEFRGDAVEAETDREAIGIALRIAVRSLMVAITPREAPRTIRFDADDPGQKAIVDVALSGQLSWAVDELRAYLRSHPSHPVALYNLAAILHAQGRFRDALELYDRALLQSKKDYYVSAREECASKVK